jgi:archaellum component FlaC
MSERMRQEMVAVKTRLCDVETGLVEVATRLDGVKARLDRVETRLDRVETRLDRVEARLDGVEARLDRVEARLDGVEARLDRVEARLDRVESTLHNVVVIVSGHTVAIARIEQQLTKLDKLDGLMKAVEAFTSEIIASRNERVLMNKGFFDQQSTLTDHELRLTRLERHEQS